MDFPTLFCGLPERHKGITIGEEGLLFGTFDQAVTRGQFVYECTVDVRDGVDPVEHEGSMVRIWDARRVTITDVFDTHCPEPLDEDAAMHQMLVEFTPDEGSHVLMLTGKLAHAGLNRVMKALDPQTFTYEIRVLDKAVAAWFTVDFVAENVGDLDGVDMILLPGKTMGEVEDLERRLGVRVVRGTNCYSELPTFFEMAGVEVTSDDIVRPKIIVIGRPGSGKTLYSDELASTYEIPHVGISDLIRSGVEEGDETAILATEYLGRGELVPHNVMAELVRSRLLMPDMRNGFVLDGYPRIVRDIQWLSDMGIKPDAVVHLLCDPAVAKQRLIAAGKKDYALVGKTVAEFEEETAGVVNHYKTLPGFVEVNTSGEDVLTELYTALETMFQKCLTPDGDDAAI